MAEAVVGTLAEPMPQVSEVLLRALYTQAPVGIYFMSAEGKCLWTNPRLREIAGYSLEESLGDGWQQFVHADDRQRLVSACTQAWAGQKPLDDEFRYVHKDGAIRWARAMSTTLADEHGAIIGHAGVVEDITERNRLAHIAQAARDELQQQQSREKEQIQLDLEAARSDLLRNARLSALGQLAGSVAHELRNPLDAIRNAVFLLERSLERGVPMDDPKWARYLAMIGHEVLASDQIINNMLEMTRPKEPARQNVEIGGIVRELFGRTPNERGVVFLFSARPDPCYIDADPVQIRQVFDNLLKNALDAIPYQQPGRIEIETEQSRDTTRIVVRDNGTGINQSLRENLFEPLITSKPKGTGLGLWVSRQIVERHGGTLDLADCDQGASFVIVLPRRRRLGSEPRAPAEPDQGK